MVNFDPNHLRTGWTELAKKNLGHLWQKRTSQILARYAQKPCMDFTDFIAFYMIGLVKIQEFSFNTNANFLYNLSICNFYLICCKIYIYAIVLYNINTIKWLGKGSWTFTTLSQVKGTQTNLKFEGLAFMNIFPRISPPPPSPKQIQQQRTFTDQIQLLGRFKGHNHLSSICPDWVM